MATLGEMITRWRRQLDDGSTPYGWDPEELVEYANRVVEDFARECWLIEDASSSITTLTTAADQPSYSISEKILRIDRAKISSQNHPLVTATRQEFDARWLGWETAESATPRYLIFQGVGEGTVRLMPTPDDIYTINMVVYRLPLTDLSASTLDGVPEIPSRYHRLLDDGVYALAYGKHDEDTEVQKLALRYKKDHERNMENVRRREIQRNHMDEMAQPNLAFT